MDKMEISVVIPLFNREGFIRETLHSVENQTSLPVEVIIVDDKSTDNSVVAVKAYAKESRLKINIIENKRTKGMSGALNYGIENAKGSFIAMMDSDDLWTPVHLIQLHGAISKFPHADIALSEFELFGDALDLLDKTNDFKNSVSRCLEIAFKKIGGNIWLSDENLLYALLRFGFPFRCQGSLVKKELFLKHRLFFDEEISYSQDSQFMLMAAYYTPFVFVKNVGLRYRRHAENDGDKSYGDKISKSYQVRIIKLQKYFKDKKMTGKERRALKSFQWEMKTYIFLANWEKMCFINKGAKMLGLLVMSPSLKTLISLLRIILSIRNQNE